MSFLKHRHFIDAIAVTREEFDSICSYIESISGYIIKCVTDESIKHGNRHLIHSSKCDIMKQEFYNNGYCNKRIITIHAIPNKPYKSSDDDIRIIVDQEMVHGIMKAGFTCYDVEEQRYINKKYPFMHIELIQIDPHPVYGIVIPDFTLRIN